MYAYTDDKILADLFRLMRRKDLFYEKKVFASKDDLYDLHNRYAINQIELYRKFRIDRNEIHFPITRLEKINIEHKANQTMVDLSVMVSDIPLSIFKPKLRRCLEQLGWGILYDEYHGVSDILTEKYIKPDLLKTFLYMYGDTLEEVNFKR